MRPSEHNHTPCDAHKDQLLHDLLMLMDMHDWFEVEAIGHNHEKRISRRIRVVVEDVPYLTGRV